jgi:prepilin-type N-terminal cleavage/methylation domain-containing protein
VSRRRQRGFTLIELMVALVVSSLLVGMILAIFSRMSMSYRGQQQIAGVQQVLAAARATIELDAKQAGLEVSQGFKIASDGAVGAGTIHQPIHVTDSATGPDQIAFFYADTTTQALVTGVVAWPGTITVDQPVGFLPGSLVVLVNVDVSGAAPITTATPGDPVIAKYTACVVQIDPAAGSVAAANPGTIRFSLVAPWGGVGAGLDHCVKPTIGTTMLYNFIARAYRVDNSTPTQAALGPLQQSATGGLLNSAADNWTDLAYGFTDIQTALRVYEEGDLVDADGDGDPRRDWYSDAAQDNRTRVAAFDLAPPLPAPIQMTISLVARTDRDIEGIATAQTPPLSVAGNLTNNTLGNHPSVVLPSATDDLLKGSRIYRYVTFQVDFRNLGVGR